ncbi:MAG: alanine:cation symporter family protein [Bacteroidales bacterium]
MDLPEPVHRSKYWLAPSPPLGFVISIFDGAYALMAFPNMIAVILLSPRIGRAAREYFTRMKGRAGLS